MGTVLAFTRESSRASFQVVTIGNVATLCGALPEAAGALRYAAKLAREDMAPRVVWRDIGARWTVTPEAPAGAFDVVKVGPLGAVAFVRGSHALRALETCNLVRCVSESAAR